MECEEHFSQTYCETIRQHAHSIYMAFFIVCALRLKWWCLIRTRHRIDCVRSCRVPISALQLTYKEAAHHRLISAIIPVDFGSIGIERRVTFYTMFRIFQTHKGKLIRWIGHKARQKALHTQSRLTIDSNWSECECGGRHLGEEDEEGKKVPNSSARCGTHSTEFPKEKQISRRDHWMFKSRDTTL